MDETPRDDEREERITMEIIVDAYGPEEQALGGYYYLDDKLHFPFTARCIARRVTSPLQVGDEIDVVGMAPEDECEREMFVMTRWERGSLALPLSQLEGVAVDAQPLEAIADWHYWVGHGYEF